MIKKNEVFLLKQSERGMSLVEILIALSLLAIGGAFIAGKAFDSYQEGLQKSAQIQVQNLAQRLKEFRRYCGQYPTSDQGLEALVSEPAGGKPCKRYPPGGLIDGGKIPKDPWDNDFEYRSDDGKTITIISYGNDGVEGGEGADADVTLSE